MKEHEWETKRCTWCKLAKKMFRGNYCEEHLAKIEAVVEERLNEIDATVSGQVTQPPAAPAAAGEPASTTPAAAGEPASTTPAAAVESAPTAPAAAVEPASTTPAAAVESASTAPAAAVEPGRCVSCIVNPADGDSKYCEDCAANEICKFCGICGMSKRSDSFVTCPNCRDVMKAEIFACRDCPLARQADPNAATCKMHSQKFHAACEKARALTDASDASAKGTHTALAGAIEPPASSGSAKGARRRPCELCNACQPKEGSRHCARCDVAVSVWHSYFDDTNGCFRCKAAQLNATGRYCDTHRDEINNEIDKRMANP
jgi:hypothetical protein